MRILSSIRYALRIAVASALLAGCGGVQAFDGVPIGPVTSAADRSANSGDLIYAAAQSSSYVLTYPQGKVVGTIDTGAQDACSDRAGNVFMTQSTQVAEYSHGSTTPSATLAVPGYSIGCAVDPMTGDLAVTFAMTGGSDVAVFKNASSKPALYDASPNSDPATRVTYCAYDKAGNLFVDTYYKKVAGLAELPAVGNAFSQISISPKIKSPPGRLQWRDADLTLEANLGPHKQISALQIDHLSVSGSAAKIVGATTFQGIGKVAHLSWIYRTAIIVPFSAATFGAHFNTPDVGYWNYPSGGAPKQVLQWPAGRSTDIKALTISAAP
jgi:hypothetical protein